MNASFFYKFKRKSLVFSLIFLFLLIFLSCFIPILRTPVINTLKLSLQLSNFLGREAGGIIFYHRNLVQSERLQKEIDFLRRKLNQTDEFSFENTRLNGLLALKERSSYKIIAARVIGRSADNWSSAIIIDKGSSSGIKHGMAVITYLGLVGRVVTTTGASSNIKLINDPDISVSCMVQRSRQEGLVSGALGSSLIMKYLPKEADIKAGDAIITSGLTEAYPKGLIVGTVVNVGEELSGLTRYAVIKPAVNLNSIEEVLIIVRQ